MPASWPQRKPPGVARKTSPASKALPEYMLQAAFIAELRALEAEGWPLTCAGDMNAARRSPQEAAKCKAMGMTPGETDVRVYLKDGVTLLVELKPVGKKLSAAQVERHARLLDLGHTVTTVWLESLQHARQTARAIATTWLGNGGWG